MTESITPWLHIVAVTVWVGPQFFLFIAAIPAVRTIEDARVRAQVLRKITTRFGWMAWAAIAVLIATGISMIFQVDADTDFNILSRDFRWRRVFEDKMVLVALMLVLTAVHTFIVGPRQLRLTEQMDADPKETARLRRASMIISGSILVISVVVIFMGALLANHAYSLQPR
jgi:copper resistance protein D